MEQPINLKELTTGELKILFYDNLAMKEQSQRNLDAINKEIAIRLQKEQVNGQEKILDNTGTGR